MKRVAFIFARGGSKGLPGKNIKPLAGKPLITYAIETARKVASVHAVYVSTDDPNIAKVAHDAQAQVIMRPPELASDTAPEWLAWRHAIDTVTKQDGPFDLFISLPPTSPLRAVKDIENTIAAFEADPTADVCLAVTPAARSPYFNMVVRTSNDDIQLAIQPSASISRRQDAPDVFDITTVAYAVNPNFIQAKNALFEGRVIAVEVPKERAVDIDDIWDFRFAESILRGNS